MTVNSMKKPLTRREALKSVATAGAGAILTTGLAPAQNGAILVAGRPVEIALTPASPPHVSGLSSAHAALSAGA